MIGNFNKIKKGFIQIPILIAIIIAISIITSAVLYKTGRLNFGANISESVKKNVEVVQQKESEIESQPKEIIQEEDSQIKQELEQARLEAEKTQAKAKETQLEAERLKAEQEAKKMKEEAERAKIEKEAKANIEAERLKVEQEIKEQQKQEEAQRIAEENQKQKEQEIFQKIKSDVNYYSNQISSIETDINQTANSYKTALDKCKIQYLNQADSAESIYSPEMEKLHREILNEATKGLWTNCMTLGSFWNYQNSYYKKYSTALTNAERTLENDVQITANAYSPDINYLQGLANNYKDKLRQLSQKLTTLSDTKSLKNEISNLETKLNSLESKFSEAKIYTVSYPTPASKLSVVEKLMQEEKNYFAETSCGNLPKY